MAKFIKTQGNFRIYELDENECKAHGREYPTLVCWDKDDHEDIGNMSYTENETETLEEMVKWCNEYSY
jgi:hypothetical protein